MQLIDAHAHLTHTESETLHDELKRAELAGIKAVINVCMDAEDLNRGLALAKASTFPKVYLAASCTPHDASRDDDAFFALCKKTAEEKQLVAIGETGLDYYYEHSAKKRQKEIFSRYIALANEVNLPIIIHCRDAFDDVEDMLVAECKTRVMMHCFTGTVEEAKRAINRGWYISLSGIVTFNKSISLQEVASIIPAELLLIETDSPYLAPQGFRGKKNEPAYIKITAEFMANLRGVSVDALAHQTAENTKTLFNLKGI